MALKGFIEHLDASHATIKQIGLTIMCPFLITRFIRKDSN